MYFILLVFVIIYFVIFKFIYDGKKNLRVVDAVVVGYEGYRNYNEASFQDPIVEFEGIRFTLRNSIGFITERYEIGSILKVRYNRVVPSESTVDNYEREIFYGFILSFIYISILVVNSILNG